MATAWKIAPGDQARVWPETSRQGCITINWMNKVNFLEFETREDLREALKEEEFGGTSPNSIWYFVHDVQKGDTVVANIGIKGIAGIGVVESEYLPPDDARNPRRTAEGHRHSRLVNWVIDKEIVLERPVFHGRIPPTVQKLDKDQCEEIRQAYLDEDPTLKDKLDKLFGETDGQAPAPEGDVTMRTLLEQLGQIIVYGPPGTGKTREAKRVALSLLTGKDSAADAGASDNNIEEQLGPFRDAGRFDLVVFHPAYEYEQFVGGIEPKVIDKQLSFEAKAGAFTQLCRKAQKDTQPVVLIIDEINRGHLPKLLGELVYALEYRGHKVRLPFVVDGRTDLVVPKNLYIIATMNSSDRSIGHIDVAIRRRFGLYHLGGKPEVVQQVWTSAGDYSYGKKLAVLMQRINKILSDHDPSAGVELGVGHSYFLPAQQEVVEKQVEAAKKHVQMKWDYQVRPLLHEYAQFLNLGTNFLQEFSKSLNQCLDGS